MAAPECLYRVSAPHFVAGLLVRFGKVIRTAPILRYMHGWELLDALAYCRRKGWQWEQVDG